MSAPALERIALLNRQKHAADRSHHYWFLARLRIMQGYLGAAKFYQHEAARWHQRAVELRAEIVGPRVSVTCQRTGRVFEIARYTGPVAPPIAVSTGSKPNPNPESFARFLA